MTSSLPEQAASATGGRRNDGPADANKATANRAAIDSASLISTALPFRRDLCRHVSDRRWQVNGEGQTLASCNKGSIDGLTPLDFVWFPTANTAINPSNPTQRLRRSTARRKARPRAPPPRAVAPTPGKRCPGYGHVSNGGSTSTGGGGSG